MILISWHKLVNRLIYLLMNQNYNPYSYKILAHVWSFCEEYKLIQGNDIVIALSGGLDSMALLWVFKQFYLQGKIPNPPRAVTINHQTRSEIADELLVIKEQCRMLGIKHSVIKVDGLNLSDSNFENLARLKRYESLFKDLHENEILLFAHHLDDCFEWSLMQQFKSSNLVATLGIPVKRGKVRRPFFCLSRRQIKKLVGLESIVFMDDSSNANLKFERNFVRHKIVKNVKDKFPGYLKHYVAKQLQYKFLLKNSFSKNQFTHKREWGYLIAVTNVHELLSVTELKSSLVKLSNVSRGKISTQAQIVVDKFNLNRGQITGPYDFSGGVKVYHFGHFLLITRQSEIGLSTSQISESFPFLVKTKKNQGLKNILSPFRKALEQAIKDHDSVGYFFKNPTGDVLFFL